LAESANAPDSTGGRSALSEALFRSGAVRFGRFTLPGGKRSSYSLDLSVVPSDPEAYALSVGAYLAILREAGEESFDSVAGAGTAGTAFSSPVAYLLKKPLVTLSRDESGRRHGELVEGAVRPGWRTVIIDGVADGGERLASMTEALSSAGCVVKTALVLVDRLEGARVKIAASGVKLVAFTDIRDLARILLDRGRITKADGQAVRKQTEGELQ
jgi:orotate phosphoribosyltransferase